MRSLIVTAFVSADGVMDSPGGGDHRSAGWSFKDVEFDPDVYTLKEQERNETGALLLGRQTYQEFAPVWPSMEEFATYNAMPKYVVSRTLEQVDPNWPATILRSIDDVARLKEETDGGTIAVHGSARLGASLADAGLVDRYHLLVFPVLLGAGKRLFSEADKERTKLRLVEQEAYGNGVIKLIYDVVR